MSKSTNLPIEPATPTPHEPALVDAGGRKKLLARRTLRSIPRLPVGSSPPLSFAQERLWLLEQLEPGSPAYNRPLALRLTGALDAAALSRALQAIVDRHEILRTCFITRDAQAVPVVSPGHKLQLPLVELADGDSAQRLEQAQRLATEDSLRPFDLERQPPFRATLFRLSAEDHVLLLVFHHIAFDGWSARVFQHEFAALYRQFHSGDSAVLPELPIQYSDFAHWQRELSGEQARGSLDQYWVPHLRGILPLDLPTDRPRPSVQSHRGAGVVVDLCESVTDSLKALGRNENCTLFMVLLAAYQSLLARYTGSHDIAVGSPIGLRPKA
jgi:hypothetical protein